MTLTPPRPCPDLTGVSLVSIVKNQFSRHVYVVKSTKVGERFHALVRTHGKEPSGFAVDSLCWTFPNEDAIRHAHSYICGFVHMSPDDLFQVSQDNLLYLKSLGGVPYEFVA